MGSFAQKKGTHNSPASQIQTTKLLWNHTTARLLYILLPSVCKETVLPLRYSFKPFPHVTGAFLYCWGNIRGALLCHFILGLCGVSVWLAPMYGKFWEPVKSDSHESFGQVFLWGARKVWFMKRE